MDRITKSLLKDFVESESLQSLSDDAAFERFANYCILMNECSETFNVEDISTGSGNDAGIDGLAILVNGSLVNNEEDVADLYEQNKYIGATFILVQAKSSKNFETAQIGNFFFGVKEFFSEESRLPLNDRVQAAAAIQNAIFSRSAYMKYGRPACKLFYVTTGKWVEDDNLSSRIANGKKDLEALELFDKIEFHSVDATKLQRLYHSTKNRVSAEIVFPSKVTLPEMDGVKEAYLGVLPVSEYMKLIVDESGSPRKSLFYENVRDFQDYNDVNREIRETVRDKDKQDKFCVLNNGITVVAKTLRPVGNRFHIEDYQIVNGCQTSHVLFDERDSLGENVYVPIKLIVTKDDSITTAITRATNRQTQVKIEQLLALSDFQKNLENYFSTFDGKERLYYERRSRQYNDNHSVEKVRIITVSQQLQAFAAMFLNQPHLVSSSYGKLLKELGKSVFAKDHKLEPYYVSAYAYYKMEFLFRNTRIDSRYKQARFPILLAFRLLVSGYKMPSLEANKMQGYCDKLQQTLWDDRKSLEIFQRATEVIDDALKNTNNPSKRDERDLIRSKSFTDYIVSRFE